MPGKTFSEDVLKIENCGPDEDYLTVIDVPGIFRLTTEGVTTKRDRDMVLDMIRNYIKNERTIILAVLPSNVDVQTQEILELAEEYDKTGERTLGVLTKVDLLKEESSKTPVCNLVLGVKRPLALGYYLVRNRGGDEDASVDVAQLEEELFQQQPWKDLPRDRVGTTALKAQLTELLSQITDRAFPKIRREATEKLAVAQKSLDALGLSRQDKREQQIYLSDIAGQFQKLVRAALDADYSVHPAFECHESLRLITSVVNITENFSTDFESNGHLRRFENIEVASSPNTENDINDVDDSSSIHPVFGNSVSTNIKSDQAKLHDLENIVTNDWNVSPPGEGIMDWIQDLYYRSRGIELGTCGARMLSSAFKEQSKKWDPITKQYISKVITAIHKFVMQALVTVCADPRVCDQVSSTILHDIRKRYKNGMDQAMFLIDVERNRRPYTLNHYFNENLQKCRGIRISDILRSKARVENSANQGWAPNLVVDFHVIKDAATSKSNEEHIQEDIHDILKSYYKVARKRFVDNVYHQAVEHCLLVGPDSPLNVFSENWVVLKEKEQLEAIAGESRSTKNRRSALKKEIEDLKAAIETLM